MGDLTIVGPIGIRQHVLEHVCNESVGHKHNYDHTTIIIRGRVKVTYSYEKDGVIVEGESREFGQGEAIFIKANVNHTIKALEDNTVYHCVFSHRDFDGLVSQVYTGNTQAYK